VVRAIRALNDTVFLSAVIARHYHFLYRLRANALLSRSYAVGHQAFCVVLFQDHERVWR
jgi:hypothetical protein